MKAEIITIGDEILIGQIVDTNSSWLGQQLSKLGIRVVHRSSVSDNKLQIIETLNEAKKHADLIIMTGGLGPTKDDVTKTTLCEYFNVRLIENEKVLAWLMKIFKDRKVPMVEANKLQAMVPENCEVLFNRSGTAPGMWFNDGNKVFISMPGVPFEMKTIFEEECIPRLKQKFELPSIIHRTIQTVGIGESFLAKKIETWEDGLPEHISLAYLPSVGQVRLRLSGYGNNRDQLSMEINDLIARLYELVSDYIFGEEEDSLQKVVGVLLKGKEKTISTAESCTGGYVSHLLTSIPGSSTYYKGSIIAYDNEIKMQELGVKEETLKTMGAVSEECVKQMAEGAREKFKTDYAIATSGIAGPDGGTPTKPVGTVWIAVSSKKQTITHLFNMGDDRGRTIERTGTYSLDMLRKMILASE